MAGAPNFAGDLTADDLADYSVIEREAVCAPYRVYRVCGMGPPSSGGIAIAQILQLLEPFDLGQVTDGRLPAGGVHLILEAEKLAYADRGRYLADPAFVTIPSGLTDAAYLTERRKLIDPAEGDGRLRHRDCRRALPSARSEPTRRWRRREPAIFRSSTRTAMRWR